MGVRPAIMRPAAVAVLGAADPDGWIQDAGGTLTRSGKARLSA